MRVLLATDGSKDAQAATAFLKELPLPPLTEVRIAAVVPLPSFLLDVPSVREFKRSALEDVRGIVEDACASLAPRGFGIETDVAVGDPKEQRRGQLENVLVKAAEHFDEKVTRVTRSTRAGDPASEVIATATGYDTDLVVVGARGLGGMARLLLGSVSEKVLRDARCPVLIVKKRPKA